MGTGVTMEEVNEGSGQAQGPESTRKRGSRLLLAVLGVLALAAVGIVGARVAAHLAREDTPERRADLAELLAAPLFEEGKAPPDPSLAQRVVEIRHHERELQESAGHCRDLSRFARSALDRLDESRVLSRTLPNPEDLVGAIAQTALGIATSSLEHTRMGGKSLIEELQDLARFLREFKVIQVRSQANLIEFAKATSGQFGGPPTDKQVVALKFRSSSDIFSFATADVLTLENTTKTTLHDCLLMVCITNKAGESFVNVHFLREWPGGSKRVAVYDTGMFGTTVADPTEVTVQLWCREFTPPIASIKAGFFGW